MSTVETSTVARSTVGVPTVVHDALPISVFNCCPLSSSLHGPLARGGEKLIPVEPFCLLLVFGLHSLLMLGRTAGPGRCGHDLSPLLTRRAASIVVRLLMVSRGFVLD